jgi:hypothetical protein
MNLLALSHVSVFVLPVGLSVITDDPVCIGGGGWSLARRGDLSVYVVVKSLEETLSQIKVTDGVNAVLEDYAAGKLTVSVAPVVLDAF